MRDILGTKNVRVEENHVLSFLYFYKVRNVKMDCNSSSTQWNSQKKKTS